MWTDRGGRLRFKAWRDAVLGLKSSTLEALKLTEKAAFVLTFYQCWQLLVMKSVSVDSKSGLFVSMASSPPVVFEAGSPPEKGVSMTDSKGSSMNPATDKVLPFLKRNPGTLKNECVFCVPRGVAVAVSVAVL